MAEPQVTGDGWKIGFVMLAGVIAVIIILGLGNLFMRIGQEEAQDRGMVQRVTHLETELEALKAMLRREIPPPSSYRDRDRKPGP